MDSRRRGCDETTVRVRAYPADEDDAEEIPVIRVVLRPSPTTVATPFQLQVAVDPPDGVTPRR